MNEPPNLRRYRQEGYSIYPSLSKEKSNLSKDLIEITLDYSIKSSGSILTIFIPYSLPATHLYICKGILTHTKRRWTIVMIE